MQRYGAQISIEIRHRSCESPFPLINFIKNPKRVWHRFTARPGSRAGARRTARRGHLVPLTQI